MPMPFERAGQGRALVLVHGNYASSRWWKPFLASPLEGWARFAPTLPGFAGTPALETTSVQTLADQLEVFIAEQELEQPVLLGHSLGGAVALELVGRDPQRYAGLILVSSPPLTGFPHNPAGDAIRARLPHDRVLLEQLFTLQSPNLPLERREVVDWNGILDDAQALPSAIGNGVSAALGAWNIEARGAALRPVPTLILAGERDPLVTAAMTRELHAQLPHATLELHPEVGHWYALEDPEGFAAKLAAWLEAIPAHAPVSANSLDGVERRLWQVGDSRCLERAVTDADVRAFAHVSGDVNPLHLDDAYAARSRFGQRIAHGALLGAFISNLVGNRIPGEGSVYLSSSLRFRHPTFIGDTVTIRATIKTIRPDKPIFTLECVCTNAAGTVLCEGESVVLYDPQ